MLCEVLFAGQPASSRCHLLSDKGDTWPSPGSLTHTPLPVTSCRGVCERDPEAVTSVTVLMVADFCGRSDARPYRNYLCVKTHSPRSHWGYRGDARARLIHMSGAWARAGVRTDADGACASSVHARVRTVRRPDHPGRVSARCHGSSHTGSTESYLSAAGVLSKLWEVLSAPFWEHLCSPGSRLDVTWAPGPRIHSGGSVK